MKLVSLRNVLPGLVLAFSLQAAAAETLQDALDAIQAGDTARAFGIYTQLAAEGNAKAEYNLGQMYLSGDGVSQDMDQATHWFRRSAEHGFAEAQYMLGSLHFHRVAPLQSPEEAIMWYRKAAEQGHARSELNLGDLYLKGEVVPQDTGQALRWYRLAASHGSGEAQHHLGMLYVSGEGVDKDLVQGYMWLKLAVENAEPQHRMRTAKVLRFTEANMTAEQLETANARLQQCKERGLKDC